MKSFAYTFIDFDETLFHTEDFKNALLSKVAPYGVTPADFWSTLRLTENSPERTTYYDYTFEKHLERLRARGYKIPEGILAEFANALSWHMPKFVFADAENFLKSMRAMSEHLMLLSSGNRDFQLFKIQASGLAEHFDEIIIIHDHKETIIDYFTEQGKKTCLFVNDNLEENIRTRETIQSVKVFSKINLLKFSKDEYRVSGIPAYATLSEIQEACRTI